MTDEGIAFRELARGKYLEALLVEGDDVWFSDVIDGGIHRLRPDGSRETRLAGRRMIGGLIRNHDGCILVSGGDGIVWFDPDGEGEGVLLDSLGGRAMRGINEMRADSSGALLFGEVDLPAILRGGQPGPSALFRLTPDRGLTMLAEGLAFTNGLCPSPDGVRLYHNQSFVGTDVYPIRGDGSLGEARRLLDKQDCDGMALDADGNLWITGFGSPFLLCLDGESGEILRSVALPGPACTNVRFGGGDLRDLYVTIVSPETAMALAEGRLPDAETSALHVGRSPVAGAPLARARFDLR